jgi:hypothetical protein
VVVVDYSDVCVERYVSTEDGGEQKHYENWESYGPKDGSSFSEKRLDVLDGYSYD